LNFCKNVKILKNEIYKVQQLEMKVVDL